MRNPLNRRYIRELKEDLGKYLVIFLFMVLFTGAMSGFFVAGGSVIDLYYKSHEELNLEDGHITFNKMPEDTLLRELEDENQLHFYPLFYKEETLEEKGSTLRIYADREEVDLVSILEGQMPESKDQIAIDRLYAQNNHLKIGDEITIHHRSYVIQATIALADYSALYQNNNDLMFDSINFGVAILSKEGYEALTTTHEKYNYAWLYDEKPKNDEEANIRYEDFMESLEDLILDYNKELVGDKYDPLGLMDVEGMEEVIRGFYQFMGIEEEENDDYLLVDDLLPKYLNQAITFVGTDGSSDRASAQMMTYIITAIIAFVFAVSISNTIQKEATVIGTLRASGYSRGELVGHYMFLPLLITILGCMMGNILGYTVFADRFKDVYYKNYCLPNYHPVFNGEAFLHTTIIPIILMIVINLWVLVRSLRVKPLVFLRGERKEDKKGRSILRLPARLPFIIRFQLRILFQNIASYMVLAFGIFIAGVLAVFGFMFLPLLEDYGKLIVDTKICEYQYVLMEEAETSNQQAEKYCLSTLTTVKESYLSDDVSVYGIVEDSQYIQMEIPKGQALISSAAAEKYQLKQGDSFSAKEKYENKTYTFYVADVYQNDASIAVFLNKEDYLETFDKEEDYYTGYFSNELLTDISEDDIASIIDVNALSKLSIQMTASFGSFMVIFQMLGAAIFILLMFILTKQIIERNIKSISLVKILGFNNGEIAGLYLVITSVVIAVSLLISVPIIDRVLHIIMTSYMYRRISGYIPYIVDNSCYVKTVLMGLICYLFVSICMIFKIRRLPKGEILKNQIF